MSIGHAEWIGNFALCPPALGGRGRPSWSGRPATSSPGRSARCWRWLPPCSSSRRWCCSPHAASRRERRAAGVPLAIAAAAVGIPLAARAGLARQGLRPRPQPDAGAGPAAGRGADRGHAARRPAAPARRSARRWSPTRSASASGPASRRPSSGPTGTPSRRSSANRRRRGRSSPGRWGRRSLRYYLSTGSFQASADRRLRLARPRSRLRLRRPGAAAVPARLLGPGFRQAGYEQAGRLYVRRYVLPGPGLAPLRLRSVRRRPARLSAPTGSSWTESDPE